MKDQSYNINFKIPIIIKSLFFTNWYFHFRSNFISKYKEVEMLTRKIRSQWCWSNLYSILVPFNNILRRFCVKTYLDEIIFSEFYSVCCLLSLDKHSSPIRIRNSLFTNYLVFIQVKSTADSDTNIEGWLYFEGGNNFWPFLYLIIMDIWCVMVLT